MKTRLALALAATLLVSCSQGSSGEDGAQGATGAIGPQGPQGSAGPAGADGQLRIYGDGSAGTRTITADTTLGDGNLQYADFTVQAGVTLTVASGTVIRSTGTFRNEGTIEVSRAARGGRLVVNPTGALAASTVPAEAGISDQPAMMSDLGDAGQTRLQGPPGTGLLAFDARQVLRPGRRGGGGGGGCGNFSGGSGGGTLTVLAAAGIVNTGTIRANGGSGAGGGGGGGVIILASPQFVSHDGTIEANGGTGSPSGDGYANFGCGAGGGGGGGVVHFLSPNNAVNAGTTSVEGGAGGAFTALVTTLPRMGGGGGGGSGGNGGTGGLIATDGSPGQSFDGTDGHVLLTNADPTALF